MRQHGWFRPHVRGLTAISSTTLREGGGDIITSIFADGTDGFYFDFSKTDRLFTTPTGAVPADDPGENIGRALDSHSWQGRTYAQQLAVQPQLVVDGDFASGGVGNWPSGATLTATAAVVDGALEVTPTADFGRRVQAIATVAGRAYRITGRGKRVSGSAGSNVYINVNRTTSQSDDLIVSVINSTGWVDFDYTFVATTAAATICLSVRTGNVGAFDDISVKEIPGNYGAQATTSAQPKWQTGGLARFDGTDDNLLTTLAASNTGMTLLAKAKLAATGGNRGVMGVNGADGVSRCFLAFDASGYAAGGVGSDSLSVIKGSVNRSGAYCVLGLTIGASTWTLYEQGAQTNTGAKNGSCNTTLGIPLGGLNANGTFGTFANIDLTYALAIKKALTAAQIAAITNKWGTS